MRRLWIALYLCGGVIAGLILTLWLDAFAPARDEVRDGTAPSSVPPPSEPQKHTSAARDDDADRAELSTTPARDPEMHETEDGAPPVVRQPTTGRRRFVRHGQRRYPAKRDDTTPQREGVSSGFRLRNWEE